MSTLIDEKKVLAAICNEFDIDLTYSEAKEALQTLENDLSDDFYYEIDGYEFRIIAKSAIWDIYVDTIKETVLDCYDLGDMPHFVVVDWEETAKKCYADGYAHTFSSYDGDTEIYAGRYIIFRVG